MLTNLDWLPPPPADFRERLGALRKRLGGPLPDDFHEQVVALATASLSDSQLDRLARFSSELAAKPAPGLMKAKLGILGDGTLSLCVPAVIGTALRYGLSLEVVEGAYSNAVQETADRASALHRAGLDFALLASDARLLGLDTAESSAAAADSKVETAFQRLRMIVEGLRPSVTSAMLVQTVPEPLEDLFGSFDRADPGSPFAMTAALNRRIADWAATGAVILVDVARLAASVGLERWNDPRHWHASKLGFSPEFIPVYAELVARILGAARGKSKKCLVLDLDNTLWGGVIGDDGLSGIVLGQGSATGEAFVAIQRMAHELRARGIILAVCSKNEEDAARLPFREHPDMVLREDHIAVFQANWTDKAANLRAIAQTLNIGVDALVFLDDNPAERMQVRTALPLVGVPELPEDPSYYPRALAAAGYFEAVAVSKEDRERAGYYQANAERAAALSASGDMDSYLASLNMICVIAPVDALSRARASQLINKSNQYNLTTRRYSESEVEAAERDPARHAIQIRLADRFGDNGLISVIIADMRGDEWEIDTWLMSCRVLGRRVQEAALNHLVAAARQAGGRALIGRYLPTAKNKMVAGHYESLGFTFVEPLEGGGSLWRLELADYMAPSLPMQIQDNALRTVELLDL
jgi:FkbH-like protein